MVARSAAVCLEPQLMPQRARKLCAKLYAPYACMLCCTHLEAQVEALYHLSLQTARQRNPTSTTATSSTRTARRDGGIKDHLECARLFVPPHHTARHPHVLIALHLVQKRLRRCALRRAMHKQCQPAVSFIYM
jgi:hypothetical protein